MLFNHQNNKCQSQQVISSSVSCSKTKELENEIINSEGIHSVPSQQHPLVHIKSPVFTVMNIRVVGCVHSSNSIIPQMSECQLSPCFAGAEQETSWLPLSLEKNMQPFMPSALE